MKRPERLRKGYGIFCTVMNQDEDMVKAFELTDNWLKSQDLSYTARHDYLSCIETKYKIDQAMRENKNDSDKSTKTVIERATPASLTEAIKEIKRDSDLTE